MSQRYKYAAKVIVSAAAEVDDVNEEDTGPGDANFDYLLSMSIQSLTLEKVAHPLKVLYIPLILLCI